MHLLDIGVIWELRGAKAGRADEHVARWAARQPRTELFISALSITELGVAAAEMARSDKGGAAAVRAWLDARVAPAFAGRVLPVDLAVARRAGDLGYPETRNGMFAATAIEHGLTLATQEPAAFRLGRIKTVNPWRRDPAGGERGGEEIGDWREATHSGPLWLRNLFVRG